MGHEKKEEFAYPICKIKVVNYMCVCEEVLTGMLP